MTTPNLTEPYYGDGSVATKDANGVDLCYPGPDGRTLYYRGFPVGSYATYAAIVEDIQSQREAIRA